MSYGFIFLFTLHYLKIVKINSVLYCSIMFLIVRSIEAAENRDKFPRTFTVPGLEPDLIRPCRNPSEILTL